MTTLREAAQQALEAMDKATRYMSDSDYQKLNEAIDTLRAALSEPVDETTLDVSGATCFSATPAKWPVKEESR